MNNGEPVNSGPTSNPAEAVVSLDPSSGESVVDAVEGAMVGAKEALDRNTDFNKNFGAVPASGGGDSLNLPDSLNTPESTAVPPSMVPITTLLPALDKPGEETPATTVESTDALQTTTTTVPTETSVNTTTTTNTPEMTWPTTTSESVPPPTTS